MSIFTQTGYTPGDDPAGVPLIGWDNDITSVTATSEATGYPASNLLLPATHLKWKATSSAAQTLSFTTTGTKNYLAIAKHNLLTTGASIALQSVASAEAIAGTLKTLLHLDGADTSREITDTSGLDHSWRPSGNAQIDTAQSKFGGAALLLAGGSDRLDGDGSSDFAFGNGDFTIDFWMRPSTTGVTRVIYEGSSSGVFPAIVISNTNVLNYYANAALRITGTTTISTGTWYHVAVARSGSNTKMFLNGTQEGSTYTTLDNLTVAANFPRIGEDNAGNQEFQGHLDEIRILKGLAAWTANFTVATSAYADGHQNLAGGYALLLHMNGTDQSQTITDDGGNNHIFTAVNQAQIDIAQSKFGGASCLFDGTGDYLLGDGDDDFAFSTGDFTIDFWIRLNTTGTFKNLYDSRPTGVDGLYPTIYISNTNVLRYFTNSGNQISGTTALTTGTWYHIAVTRSGTSTRMFLNGAQEGSTYSDSNLYLNGTQRPVIGTEGVTLGTNSHNGWMDELRVVKGTALWTSTFVPPAHPANAFSRGYGIVIEDDKPIIFRFTPTTANLSLSIGSGSAAAEVAIVYAGELLVLERGVKVDAEHLDLPHARKTAVVSGMSESGNFLGRVVLTEWREGKAEFEWFTPDWYRTNFEPFVEQAVTHPFFWAWNPDDYPEETALAWLVEDVRPETDPATRRMHATLSMRGIA